MKKNITAIIATHNRKKYLEVILGQLYNQILPKNVSLSIIVVIDGSTDGTVEMINEKFPDVIIINGNGNWWWTKCMNKGFKKAIDLYADYILVLNDDTEIKNDYTTKLWDDYQSLPANSILGSASVTIDPSDLIDTAGTKDFIRWRLKAVSYLPAFTPIFPDFKGIHPTWTLNGRGALIPVSAFEKIGFYDENLMQYGSDDEFAMRARKSGINVFISWNVYVYNHLMQTDEGKAFRQDSFVKFLKSFFSPYSVNSFKKFSYYYKKHGYKWLLPVYLFYVFLGTLKAYFIKYKK